MMVPIIIISIMFKKKPTEETSAGLLEDTRKSVLKDKDDNYKVALPLLQFLMLVRDKEYDEAYRLGRLSIAWALQSSQGESQQPIHR